MLRQYQAKFGWNRSQHNSVKESVLSIKACFAINTPLNVSRVSKHAIVFSIIIVLLITAIVEEEALYAVKILYCSSCLIK